MYIYGYLFHWEPELASNYSPFPSPPSPPPSYTHTHTHTHTHHAQIHKLPRELCQMRHLLSFQFDSLVLTDPPPLTAKWGSHSLLHYFSLKQKDTVPWSSFRVVVVGPTSGGKTTLLTKLRGEGPVSIAPTKGLEVGQL